MKENVINYLPLKAYRYLRWLKNEKKIYRYNEKYFTKRYADICFRAERLRYKNKLQSQILDAYATKDAYILSYLEDILNKIIKQYSQRDNEETLSNSNRNTNEKKIWVFWWQGEEEAPEIVKACIKSIRKNSNGHEIIVLSQKNYEKYVSLPQFILEKHNVGIISHAAFTDIIRVFLLSMYSGMWIDATVFLSQPIPSDIFSKKWYSLKTYDQNAIYFSKSRWCGYFMTGYKEFPLFAFARDCLIEYWKEKNQIIDYLLLDYVIGLACIHIEEVRDSIDNLPNNNIERGRLMREINAPYSKELFESLANGETFASKLSWRYGNPSVRTSDGRLSNYGHLLSLNKEEEI